MGRVPRGGCAIVIALRCPLVSRCAGGDRRGTFSGRRLTSGELGDLRSPSFMRRFAKSDRTEGEAGELCWSLPRGGRVACRDGPPPGLWTADAVIAGERHAAADRGARVRVSQPSTPTPPWGSVGAACSGQQDFCSTFFGGLRPIMRAISWRISSVSSSGPKPGIAPRSLKSHEFSESPMKSRILGSADHVRRSAARVNSGGTVTCTLEL
jgi:hypothetical protein